MTDKEIVERAKEAEKRTGFGKLVHSPISKGVNSAFGIGFIEGMVEYRNSMQEEPVSKDKFTFTSLPRLLDRIKPTDRAKWYSSRLADALEKEGYITDAKIVRESIKIMNGEKVAMATMDEEPVSEDLEQAACNYGDELDNVLSVGVDDDNTVGEYAAQAYKEGAQWQKEQFEKNRLAACDRQTKEEAEIESDFVMSIIEKEHRQPTFDDAIKYGMNLQKQELTKNAVETYVDFSMAYKLNIKEGQKVKLIVIKED